MIKYILSLIFLTLTLLGCENDLEAVNALFTKDQVKIEAAKDVQLLYSDSAIVRVRVSGPKMLRYVDHTQPKEEFPEGILIEFLRSGSSQAQGRLTANYAIRLENQHKVIVREDVVWTSGKGEELRTEELTWDDQRKMVHTNRFVKIIKPEEEFYGFGFEADQNFNHWKIFNPTGKMLVEGLEEPL